MSPRHTAAESSARDGVFFNRARLFAFFLLTLLAIEVFGAEFLDLRDPREALTQYKVDVWQTEQGLPLNTVQTLLQSSDGYLWVGTGGGLARFDGVRFATFESSELNVSSRSIFGLLEDRDGNIWIGHSEGAAVYRNGRFENAFGKEVTGGRRVWAFAQAADGAIWAASESGLVRWKGEVTQILQEKDGLPTERLRTLAFDIDGRLWIGTSGSGLVFFDGSRFGSLPATSGFGHRAVRSVLPDPRGGVWAATAGGGLLHVDRDQKVKSWGIADGLPTDQLTGLALDREGTLWLGTWGAGISRMQGGKFESLSTEGGLAGAQIWSVLADREGSLWVGTWVGGLNRLRTRDFVVLGSAEGLSHDTVRSVLHDRNGVTWLTTAGGGVNRIAGSQITVLTKEDGLPSDEVSAIAEGRDGSIWIGTYTSGVARLRNGKIDTFGTAAGLLSLDVRSIFEDSSGTLWIGTTSGAARFDGRRFTPVREQGIPFETGVYSFLEDREGTLWIGTSEGLVRYRDGTFTTLRREQGLVSNWVMALHEDVSGAIWIGTNGEGISRLKQGRITSIRPADGLWDGMAQVILEDRFGNFWITCNRGFYRVSRAVLDAFVEGRRANVESFGYGPGEALRSTTFAGGHQPAGALDRAGRLWLPSFSGLVIVDPAKLPGSGAPPSVRFEEVTVNGVAVPAGEAIVLPPGSVPLSIRYVATTLRNADRVRFRYRMEGTSGGWVEAGRNREAFFPALPHGQYRFRVAASLDGKSWNETAAPLSITVRPFFFQTPWFLALVILSSVAVAMAVMRLRTRQLRRQKSEMERLVAAQTEELRLANEHLARLSFVDSLTGLANRRRFDEALEQEWQRAKRYGTSVALVVADVDLFKSYNDTLGHPEGDRCLAAVAEVFLREARRAGDLVARYGGEEFVVLIPGADQVAALEFAERLRVACEARAIPHPASTVGPVVTISIGVAAAVPTEDASSHVLLEKADAALYRAKRDGRNRVVHLGPIRDVASA